MGTGIVPVAFVAASFAAALLLVPARAAPPDGCAGSPPEAVMTLPAPLSRWGAIDCTPFGHMLEAHEGWIWVWADGSGPVFIPSQMVQRGPERLGNTSYFTRIEVAPVTGDEFGKAYNVFHEGLDDDAVLPDGYRVDLTSVSGKTMRLYFFDYDTYAWGMSCPEGQCLPSSRFMILDKAHEPQTRQPSI